jgi:hypothetical protein
VGRLLNDMTFCDLAGPWKIPASIVRVKSRLCRDVKPQKNVES